MGLIDVYNLLDQEIVDAKNVVQFQKRLQTRAICEAESGKPRWKILPRLDVNSMRTLCDVG